MHAWSRCRPVCNIRDCGADSVLLGEGQRQAVCAAFAHHAERRAYAVGRDPAPRIRHRDHDVPAVISRALEPDAPTGLRTFDRVAQQIEHDLLHLLPVGAGRTRDESRDMLLRPAAQSPLRCCAA